MEKIKLKDGTTFDIVSGSYEYVNIIAKSVDDVIPHFTAENLTVCEILSDTPEGEDPIVRESFTDKFAQNVKVELVDGGFSIVITFADTPYTADEILNIILGGE